MSMRKDKYELNRKMEDIKDGTSNNQINRRP